MSSLKHLKGLGIIKNEIRSYMEAALVGYERRMERYTKGEERLHRLGYKIRQGTRIKRMTVKKEWYKKEPRREKYEIKRWGRKKTKPSKLGCDNDTPTAPLFIPRTPGGELTRILREIVGKSNKTGKRRIKLVEEAGDTLQSLLTKADPWDNQKCMRDKCQASNQRETTVLTGQSCTGAFAYPVRRGG